MLALCAISAGSFAQNFDKVQTFLMVKPVQAMAAKVEIDKIMENPKAQSKAAGWLWKARVYSFIFDDSTLRTPNAGAINIAWESFDKYVKMDPELKLIKEDAGMPGLGMTVVDQIYGNTINIGLEHFKKEQWPEALDMFQYGYNMGDFITHYNLRNNKQAYDTISVLYAGYAAHNYAGYFTQKGEKEEAQKYIDVALKYYGILADSKVGGADYLPTYKYILIAYSDKKDSTSFYKYLAIAKENYPKEPWDEFEADFINKSYTIDQKLAYYKRHDALNDFTSMQYFLLADDFSSPSTETKKGLDSVKLEELKEVGLDAYKKSFGKDKTMGIAAFNAGVISYNKFSKLDDKRSDNLKIIQDINIKKADIKDPAKKKAYDLKVAKMVDSVKAANATIDVTIIKESDGAIEWLENTYNTFKDKEKPTKSERNCLNKSVDLLANVYSYRRDKAKGKDAKAYDAFDAKYKIYDALHDKF